MRSTGLPVTAAISFQKSSPAALLHEYFFRYDAIAFWNASAPT
jgi:hypothetical protein